MPLAPPSAAAPQRPAPPPVSAARIRRNGAATLSTYGIAAGLTPSEARTVAGSLRNAGKRLGVEGVPARVHAKGRMRDARRYTPAEVAAMANAYRPHRTEYKAAKARLALAA